MSEDDVVDIRAYVDPDVVQHGLCASCGHSHLFFNQEELICDYCIQYCHKGCTCKRFVPVWRTEKLLKIANSLLPISVREEGEEHKTAITVTETSMTLYVNFTTESDGVKYRRCIKIPKASCSIPGIKTSLTATGAIGEWEPLVYDR